MLIISWFFDYSSYCSYLPTFNRESLTSKIFEGTLVKVRLETRELWHWEGGEIIEPGWLVEVIAAGGG